MIHTFILRRRSPDHAPSSGRGSQLGRLADRAAEGRLTECLKLAGDARWVKVVGKGDTAASKRSPARRIVKQGRHRARQSGRIFRLHEHAGPGLAYGLGDTCRPSDDARGADRRRLHRHLVHPLHDGRDEDQIRCGQDGS